MPRSWDARRDVTTFVLASPDAFARGFQEALEITVDGIVGPVTWRAMVSGMLSG